MLDEGSLRGEDIRAFGGGNGSAHERGIALVSHPTVCGVEVRGVIAAFVQCENGNEAYGRVVAEFQLMATGDVEFNVADPDGINS